MCQSASASLEEYASIMFCQNQNDNDLPLLLDEVATSKDLFCLCIDLLCRGLILMFGNSTHHVELSDLSMQQFEMLKNKMKRGGIIPHLSVAPFQNPLPELLDKHNIRNTINSHEIISYPDNMPLEEYNFSVTTSDKIFTVRFHIQRLSS